MWFALMCVLLTGCSMIAPEIPSVAPVDDPVFEPSPVIYPPVINGLKDCWYLTPFARTLISFEQSVYYDGEWAAESIIVRGSSYPQPYTIFHPPYESGVCHAEYGFVHENSCIVYPLYVSIDNGGLPYSPTALDTGYPHIGWKNTNALYAEFPSSSDSELEIPAQDGEIIVRIRDETGRITEARFEIPIQALDYGVSN